jgi:acetyl-CoA C-acetyltransferase
VTHSIAAMAGVLRSDPGALGLVTANGGYVTKHALGLYSTSPPAAGGFRRDDVQDQVDALPKRSVASSPDGAARVESWVVQHDRSGSPERAIAACLLDDGRRAWGVSADADVVAELRSGAEQIGRKVELGADGDLRL